MKWLNLLLIGVVAFAFNACESHPTSDLAILQMSNEPPVPVQDKKNGPETSAPSDASKPAAPKFYQP